MACPRSRTSQATVVLLASSVLLPSVAAVGFNCKEVIADGVHWNLGKLGGPHSVSWVYEEFPSITNFTFTWDLCRPLVKDKNIPDDHQCPTNTRVCGIRKTHEPDQNSSMHWVAIAGDYTLKTGRHLEVIPTRLKNSRSHSDAEREGLSLELTGGKDNGKNQKAIIELLCSPGKTGWEPEPEPHTRSEMVRKRDDSYESEEDDNKDDDDANRAIKFISYKDESTKNENWDVLRLQWFTKYACEDAVSMPSDGSASWGFFTWFIVLLFLGIAAYLIFGSWLNYNRYGAKGWDLLPHGDLIRDSPYILKDLVRRVQGTGSRGGYSAV